MEFNDIKVGDYVLGAAGTHSRLTPGNRYRVRSLRYPYVRVVDDTGAVDGFYAARFSAENTRRASAPVPPCVPLDPAPTITVASLKAAMLFVYDLDPSADSLGRMQELAARLGLNIEEVTPPPPTIRFVD